MIDTLETWKLQLTDCSGACFPGPPGQTVDRLRVSSIYRLREQVLWLLNNTSVPHGASEESLRRLHEAIEQMSRSHFVAAFDHPVAYNHLAGARISRSSRVRGALGLVRFLIGAPGVEDLRTVIPTETFPAEGLYLPHLHVRLLNMDGPVAVHADGESIRFTWVDGWALTIPSTGLTGHADLVAGRLAVGQEVAGWQVLNGLAELLLPPLELPASGEPSVGELEIFIEGLRVLEYTWPMAYAASWRFLRHIFIMPAPDDHSISSTNSLLQGGLIASIHSPSQVGDAICHEGSHTRLSLVFEADPLIEDDGAAVHTSPWRRDLRPLKGVLNGVHAFLNVCEYYRRLAKTFPGMGESEYIFDLQRAKVIQGWEYLKEHAKTTVLGDVFFAEIEQAVENLRSGNAMAM